MTSLPEVLIFTDLDDSLFSTLKKIPETNRKNLTIAARAAGGKDSYMTRHQSSVLNWMDVSRCVPVTARGTEAYSRVELTFAGPAAIVANGAVILDRDGTANIEWANTVAKLLKPYQELLLELPATLKQLAASQTLDIRSWTVTEPSCDAVYAVAKLNSKSNNESEDQSLRRLLESFKKSTTLNQQHLQANWQYHINGNNLSIMPAGVNKATAVRHLLTQLRESSEIVSIGVGDSATDIEFMRLCDMWLTPTNSQIDLLLLNAMSATQ